MTSLNRALRIYVVSDTEDGENTGEINYSYKNKMWLKAKTQVSK